MTRQVYTGCRQGGLARTATSPCDYQISQRADFFETEVALDTMVKRPIVNTRDEPHADREKYRRLHVIVGDANLSEYTIYLRQGAAAIVLSMIEDGAIDRNLAQPARSGAGHPRGRPTTPSCTRRARRWRTATVSGTPFQIQSRVPRDGRQAYVSSRVPARTGSAKDIIVKWQRGCSSALERDPMELATRIDWVMKKAHHGEFHGAQVASTGSSHLKSQMLDLQYHDLRPDKGLYYLLERQGRAERIVTDAEINEAIYTPPADTRAFFRGECLKKYGTAVFGVNWDSISFGVDGEPIKRILMAEPLKGTKSTRRGSAR